MQFIYNSEVAYFSLGHMYIKGGLGVDFIEY